MSLVCFVVAMLETISLAKSETSCARVWDLENFKDNGSPITCRE